LAIAPIAEQAKRDLQRLYEERKDYLPGLTSDEKKAKLARKSYANFLKDVAGVHADIVKLYQTLPHGLFGVGFDAVSAQDAWGLGMPGFDGMKLDPAASAKEVEVSYARGGKVYTAKAKNAILACWHVVIPYICDELPDKQKEALASAQKVPLLYTNVALRNWTSFQKVGASSVYAPGM